MALMHCDFFSEVLGLLTSMTVILPQATTQQIGMAGTVVADRHPTLYLLHGMSDDHTIWIGSTAIERYVAPLGLSSLAKWAGVDAMSSWPSGKPPTLPPVSKAWRSPMPWW